jgi:hypothetical protein
MLDLLNIENLLYRTLILNVKYWLVLLVLHIPVVQNQFSSQMYAFLIFSDFKSLQKNSKHVKYTKVTFVHSLLNYHQQLSSHSVTQCIQFILYITLYKGHAVAYLV